MIQEAKNLAPFWPDKTITHKMGIHHLSIASVFRNIYISSVYNTCTETRPHTYNSIATETTKFDENILYYMYQVNGIYRASWKWKSYFCRLSDFVAGGICWPENHRKCLVYWIIAIKSVSNTLLILLRDFTHQNKQLEWQILDMWILSSWADNLCEH